MKHSHYHKHVGGLQFIDVYRVLQLFEVTDPAVQHAVKKLLAPGKRGAGKDERKDIQEAIDSLQRALDMRLEDEARAPKAPALPGSGPAAPTPFPPPPFSPPPYAVADVCRDCIGQPCKRTDNCPHKAPTPAAASPVAGQPPAGRG